MSFVFIATMKTNVFILFVYVVVDSGNFSAAVFSMILETCKKFCNVLIVPYLLVGLVTRLHCGMV